MEKTDKSAEEILNYKDTDCRDDIISAMREYAAQQLSEYKEVIKELLPLAALSKITVDDPNWRELWENKKTTIDRAKKLIEK